MSVGNYGAIRGFNFSDFTLHLFTLQISPLHPSDLAFTQAGDDVGEEEVLGDVDLGFEHF